MIFNLSRDVIGMFNSCMYSDIFYSLLYAVDVINPWIGVGKDLIY